MKKRNILNMCLLTVLTCTTQFNFGYCYGCDGGGWGWGGDGAWVAPTMFGSAILGGAIAAGASKSRADDRLEARIGRLEAENARLRRTQNHRIDKRVDEEDMDEPVREVEIEG